MRRRDEPTIPPLVPVVAPPVLWLESVEHRRLLVHTAADQSIEGVLRLAADDGLVLWNAVVKGKPSVQLDGEVFIPRSQVLFVQTVRM